MYSYGGDFRVLRIAYGIDFLPIEENLRQEILINLDFYKMTQNPDV